MRPWAIVVLTALLIPGGPSASAGTFDYTITQLSPSTQSNPDLFTNTYYFFSVTNTSASPDSFLLDVQNLVAVPSNDWFGQVCLNFSCFIPPATIQLQAGESESLGVNVAPFSDGVGTFDFYIQSIGDPQNNDTFTGLRLYAGAAAVGVDPTSSISRELTLSQNLPNPMREGTRIVFGLTREADLTLRIYDAAGRMLRTLREGRFGAGSYDVAWDGSSESGAPLASGVYFYRLETSTSTLTRRMALIR
jgi:hypothetical protein